MTRRFPLIALLAGLLAVTSPVIAEAQVAEGSTKDFNVLLIEQLSRMVGLTPTKITINYETQEKMREAFVLDVYLRCMANQRPEPEQIEEAMFRCRVSNNARIFVYGFWKRDRDDAGHIEITLYRQAGINTVIHEFVHWYLHNSIPVDGLLNDESVVEPIVSRIIADPRFVKWLSSVEKGK